VTDVAPARVSADDLAPSSRNRARSRRLRVRAPQQPLIRHLSLALCAAGILYFVTNALSQYNNYLAGEIALYVAALAGLSVLTGISGQISLGHGAFMAVGAYTVALLMTHTGINFILELLISIATAAMLGLVVGVCSTRLKGPYLAGVTLLLALALPPLADKWNSIFGGDQGLITTTPTAPGSINSYQWLAWIEMAGALLTLVILANLVRSRFGRAFRAVRDNEVAAALSGVHVARTKVTAFVVSAGCAGLAGAFLALSTGVVNTGEFPLTLSIQLLAAMVLAGSGSLVGMIWGAVLLVYVPQWSTSFSGYFGLGSGVSAYLATIFFGTVLIVVMLAAPTGIQGGLRKLWGQTSTLWLRLRGSSLKAPLLGVSPSDRA
jgi:branched-chain amino acid transport system permease protein